MNRKGSPAFTVTEAVILVLILFIVGAILASMILPSGASSTLAKGKMTGTMNNMRQIYLATQQMALEGASVKDASLCWPGDDPHPDWASFQKKLVPAYIGTNNFLKLLAAANVRVPETFPNPVGENALKIFAIKEANPGDTIFIATRNWAGFQQPLSKRSPYGEKGFVLIRKGGDAAQYSPKQVASPAATNGGFLGRTNGFVLSQYGTPWNF